MKKRKHDCLLLVYCNVAHTALFGILQHVIGAERSHTLKALENNRRRRGGFLDLLRLLQFGRFRFSQGGVFFIA